MKTVTLELPDYIDETEVKLLMVISLVDNDVISSGKAAELLGMPKARFLEVAARRSVNVFEVTREELDRDLAVIANLKS